MTGTRTAKTDRRQQKTKRAIRSALIKLMTEHTISEISITALAAEADINRKTFYMHYSSIEAVLSEMEEELSDGMAELFTQFGLWNDPLSPYYLFLCINNIIEDDMDACRSLLKSGSCTIILKKIKEALKRAIRISLGDRPIANDKLAPYAIEFISSGVIALYESWLSSEDRSVSLEELAQLAVDLVQEGLHKLGA